ncbi:unnamed protein product [Haemonchus placei]|uniref:FSA_C domain-containing protein n=1 Tax=Haemonchus placei TaxID=6290 RepID=A0A0N4W6N1_HAEPC|nr:unnamed protein product [Haemonchus placei]
MYKLPPLVPVDLDVKPIDIMYTIPSYHGTTNCNNADTMCNGLPEETFDPAKEIEHKQHDLIKSLMNLGSTLDNLLKEMEKAGTFTLVTSTSTCIIIALEVGAKKKEKVKKEPVTGAPSSSENHVAASKNDTKKDKEAKKEARKAAKAEAKSKVGTAPSSGAKSAVVGSSDRQWTINEEKTTSETGQSLTACLPQSFVEFERQSLGDITLTFMPEDQPWVEALSRVGLKRNVAFKGAVSNECKEPSTTTINTSIGGNFSVVSTGCSLKCRTTSWKLLGAALGIFSFAFNHSIQAAHQHVWLSKVDMVLAGKMYKEEIIREASRFLSQFDALGSQFNFGVADVVARSVLIGSSTSPLPNNVELWSKRLDSVM